MVETSGQCECLEANLLLVVCCDNIENLAP